MIFLAEHSTKIGGEDHNAWFAIIGSAIASIIVAFITWWTNKSKNKNDQFKVFMDESTEFREEIRKDRQALKNELEECYKIVEKYEGEIEESKDLLNVLKAQITSLKDKKSQNDPP